MSDTLFLIGDSNFFVLQRVFNYYLLKAFVHLEYRRVVFYVHI